MPQKCFFFHKYFFLLETHRKITCTLKRKNGVNISFFDTVPIYPVEAVSKIPLQQKFSFCDRYSKSVEGDVSKYQKLSLYEFKHFSGKVIVSCTEFKELFDSASNTVFYVPFATLKSCIKSFDKLKSGYLHDFSFLKLL